VARKSLPRVNFVDCALARITAQFNSANREIHWVGYPSASVIDSETLSKRFEEFIYSTASKRTLLKICKMGRTTGFTTGTIVDISFDGYVNYSKMFPPSFSPTMAWFEALSLQPIGLYFANTPDNRSLCNKIDIVMSSLGIPRI
jgi:hypothetical protein